MTDAKPVAELRRGAHDALEHILVIHANMDRHKGGEWPCDDTSHDCWNAIENVLNSLADRAEAAERTLAEERRNFLLAESALVKEAERERDEARRESGRLYGAMHDALQAPHTHSETCQIIKRALYAVPK